MKQESLHDISTGRIGVHTTKPMIVITEGQNQLGARYDDLLTTALNEHMPSAKHSIGFKYHPNK